MIVKYAKLAMPVKWIRATCNVVPVVGSPWSSGEGSHHRKVRTQNTGAAAVLVLRPAEWEKSRESEYASHGCDDQTPHKHYTPAKSYQYNPQLSFNVNHSRFASPSSADHLVGGQCIAARICQKKGLERRHERRKRNADGNICDKRKY